MGLLLQIETSAEEANDRAECANHDLKADIERWHKNKRQDFKNLFTNYSECLIEYYKQVRIMFLCAERVMVIARTTVGPNDVKRGALINHAVLR